MRRSFNPSEHAMLGPLPMCTIYTRSNQLQFWEWFGRELEHPDRNGLVSPVGGTHSRVPEEISRMEMGHEIREGEVCRHIRTFRPIEQGGDRPVVASQGPPLIFFLQRVGSQTRRPDCKTLESLQQLPLNSPLAIISYQHALNFNFSVSVQPSRRPGPAIPRQLEGPAWLPLSKIEGSALLDPHSPEVMYELIPRIAFDFVGRIRGRGAHVLDALVTGGWPPLLQSTPGTTTWPSRSWKYDPLSKAACPPQAQKYGANLERHRSSKTYVELEEVFEVQRTSMQPDRRPGNDPRPRPGHPRRGRPVHPAGAVPPGTLPMRPIGGNSCLGRASRVHHSQALGRRSSVVDHEDGGLAGRTVGPRRSGLISIERRLAGGPEGVVQSTAGAGLGRPFRWWTLSEAALAPSRRPRTAALSFGIDRATRVAGKTTPYEMV